MLDLVFLQIPFLSEGLRTVLAFERPNAFMHPHVVEQIPSFRERLVSVAVFSDVGNLLLMSDVVRLDEFLISVGLEHLVVHFVLSHAGIDAADDLLDLFQILIMNWRILQIRVAILGPLISAIRTLAAHAKACGNVIERGHGDRLQKNRVGKEDHGLLSLRVEDERRARGHGRTCELLSKHMTFHGGHERVCVHHSAV